MFKFLYETERDSLNRLRAFYEGREAEWAETIKQHKQCLNQYSVSGEEQGLYFS